MICYMGRRIRGAANLLLYYSVTLRRVAGEEQWARAELRD
jgi:hypothetical protein